MNEVKINNQTLIFKNLNIEMKILVYWYVKI
jgi:hypothetical protein